MSRNKVSRISTLIVALLAKLILVHLQYGLGGTLCLFWYNVQTIGYGRGGYEVRHFLGYVDKELSPFLFDKL